MDDDGIACDQHVHDATPQEDLADRNMLKQVKQRFESLLPGQATVHIEDAVWWRDRVRAPVTFAVAVRVDRAHFNAAHAAGGELVAEETFSEDQVCAFFCEIPRCTIRGFRAWPVRDRGLCLAAMVVFCACVLFLASHVSEFVRAG